jgi:hypothetical protein
MQSSHASEIFVMRFSDRLSDRSLQRQGLILVLMGASEIIKAEAMKHDVSPSPFSTQQRQSSDGEAGNITH